jgi:hypothetical protein
VVAAVFDAGGWVVVAAGLAVVWVALDVPQPTRREIINNIKTILKKGLNILFIPCDFEKMSLTAVISDTPFKNRVKFIYRLFQIIYTSNILPIRPGIECSNSIKRFCVTHIFQIQRFRRIRMGEGRNLVSIPGKAITCSNQGYGTNIIKIILV